MDMFLVPIAYTHMCVYRRLLTPPGNMFDTGQQTGSVVITAGQISHSFATSAWNVNLSRLSLDQSDDERNANRRQTWPGPVVTAIVCTKYGSPEVCVLRQ